VIGLGQRDENAGDPCAPADAAIAGRDAGDVRRVRPFRALRLRLDVGGWNAELRRSGEGAIEIRVVKFGAVLELVVEKTVAIARRGLCTASLIPYADEPRFAVRVEEVLVTEVEALDVDDADENVFAELVLSGRSEPAFARSRRDGLRISGRHDRHLQRLGDLDVGDARLPRKGGNLVERRLHLKDLSLAALRPIDLRGFHFRVAQVDEHVGSHGTGHALQRTWRTRLSLEIVERYRHRVGFPVLLHLFQGSR
jgi:hypothetical protein